MIPWAEFRWTTAITAIASSLLARLARKSEPQPQPRIHHSHRYNHYYYPSPRPSPSSLTFVSLSISPHRHISTHDFTFSYAERFTPAICSPASGRPRCICPFQNATAKRLARLISLPTPVKMFLGFRPCVIMSI